MNDIPTQNTEASSSATITRHDRAPAQRYVDDSRPRNAMAIRKMITWWLL